MKVPNPPEGCRWYIKDDKNKWDETFPYLYLETPIGTYKSGGYYEFSTFIWKLKPSFKQCLQRYRDALTVYQRDLEQDGDEWELVPGSEIPARY